MIDTLDIELDPRSVIAKRALELMGEGRIGDDLNMENVIGGLLFAVSALEVEVIRLREDMTDTQWVLISTDEEAILERFNDAITVREQRWTAEHKPLDSAATDDDSMDAAE